ncbi:Major facilitator superfamily multidrug transporter mdrA [Paramyrothecium foliicola]|nr:Major facilitator superfamily multidrug transporter mdrA [Paramyrothecium foliicola]
MDADPEKDSAPAASETMSCDSSEAPSSPVLAPIRTNQTRRSTAAAAQQQVDHVDMYENLHRVVTPDIETDAERRGREPIAHVRTATSVTSTASRMPEYEVIFEEGDPENPKNWPLWYRVHCLAVISVSTLVIVLYSTSYTACTPGLMEEFNASTTVVTLGLTTYLLGLAAGSLVVAPMSELYGRRIVYIISFVIWALLIIPCALAQSLTSILVIRFVGALFGASLISNGPGSVVDLSQPEFLAAAMSLWSVAPLNGPVVGPLIGGFVFEYLGWRWTNWIVLIIAGVAGALLLTVKETYAPTILQRKAARMRKELDDPRWWSQYDQRVSSMALLKANLSRPFILFATEPILWFMNLWISLIYGILYLGFVAYPIVFRQHRGWSAGLSGLAFLGIGAGTLLAIAAEPLLRRLINSQPRDANGKVQPEATALVMAIGAVMTPLGQLIFSWTCLPASIHPVISIAIAGIPFGFGNTVSFIYCAHYMANAYTIYAASALAGNAVLRSIFGGVLPLAGPRMYEALTPQWAGTLVGLLEVLLIPIPFVLWRYGSHIRARSRAVRQLQEEQDRVDAKRARYEARRLAGAKNAQEVLSGDDKGLRRASLDKGIKDQEEFAINSEEGPSSSSTKE